MADQKLKTHDELKQALCKIDKAMSFGDSHLELLSDARMDALIQFIKEHHLPDQILYKSIGNKIKMTKEDELFWRKLLSENLSLILVSNTTDEIIASRGIYISKKGKDLTEIPDGTVKTIHEFLTHKNHEMNIFKHYNVDTCVSFKWLATHRDYRRQGIATKMFQAALMFSKELGLDTVCIKGVAVSNYSQRIYEHNNFETIHTFRYDEYKVNGDIVFKNMGGNEETKVFVKRLY